MSFTSPNTASTRSSIRPRKAWWSAGWPGPPPTASFSERAELGTNYREKDPVELRGSYSDQIKYFEHPELIKADDAQWAVYPSQFGLQGIFFALIDSIDPLPRRTRIGLYHFLSALICAAAFMWVATKVRERFGFAAATGFVVPVAFEPMFTALAPNLYWAVGLWFVRWRSRWISPAPSRQTKMVADRRHGRRSLRQVAVRL